MKLSIRFVALFGGLILPAALAESPPVSSPFAVVDEAAFFSLLDLNRPDLAPVRQAVETRDWAAAKSAWSRHLMTRTTPRWLWSRRDRPAFQQIYDKQFGGLARYTKAADQVLARDFDFLGVRKQLTPKVEWLQGPIEWTHVLSRFGYWHDLGLAYWGTGQNLYAQDFVALLEDWIQSNPVPQKVSNARGERGSVWRTLEAGIRGQSWFETMELFMDAPEFDAEAKYLMTRSLVEHARYLSAWTTEFRSGNWQVCETSGLATIGIMLPEFKDSADWRGRGLQFLVQQMQKDVEPDGAHGELTPGYHTWVMNQFMHVSLLGKANGLEFPGLLARHEKMFEFLAAISRPDRTFPPVGDAGTGKRTITESMGRGVRLYQRSDFRYFSGEKCFESWVWLFGPGVCDAPGGGPATEPAFTSVLLPDSNYMVMRTGWKPDDTYLLFDCAPSRGAHSHHDRLQVTVFAGRDLIVDPGMCSYDQPQSRELRRSASHNVVMLDGQEQLQGDPELLAWHTEPAADFASGQITAPGLTHQRSVLFIKPGYWVVVDHILGQGNPEVTRLFHFPIGPAQTDGRAAHTGFPDGMNIQVQPTDDAKVEMRSGLIALDSVAWEKAPVAALVSTGTLPLTLCTVLLPYADAKELPTITAVKTDNPLVTQLRLDFANGQRDEIAISASPLPLKLGSHHGKTRALCVRQGPVANSVIEIPDGIGAAKGTLSVNALPRP